MSVPDSELWWWKKDNKPDRVRCDRNGCDRKATMQVAWRHMGEWRHIACDLHGDWWMQQLSRGSVTGWVPA